MSAPGVCACRGPPATPQVVGVVVMSLLHFMVGGGCARRGPPATPQVGGVAVMSLLHSGSAVSAPAVDRLLPRVHSAGGGHLRCSRLWFRLSGRGLSTGLNDNSIILNEI